MPKAKRRRKLPEKLFVFEVSLRAVPHTPKTAKVVFGTDYFNPDFPEHTHAVELISSMFKDAVIERIQAEIKHLGRCKREPDKMKEDDRRYYRYLQKKTRIAKEVEASLKFVRSEEIKPKTRKKKGHGRN